MGKRFVLYTVVSVLLMGQFAVGQTIDVHCHTILPGYRKVLEKHKATMEETFPLPAWDAESHMAFMEKAGIAYSVLTMPAPHPWFGDTKESQQVIREYNEYCARLKKAYPGKFKFCASLPLPDVHAAIEEAVYALDTLGADGIKLATNSRGQYIGDKALDPLMELLNRRNTVVIIHPHKPTPVNDDILAAAPLAVYEYPAETTRAVVNMIVHNVPVRYPNVKILVPHCGSFLPMAVPRMKAVHPAMLAKGYMEPIDWDGNLSRLYYDLAGGASPEIVKMMLTITTPQHILYGSDYPYMSENVLLENQKRMRQQFAGDQDLAPYSERFFSENARLLFHNESSPCPPIK